MFSGDNLQWVGKGKQETTPLPPKKKVDWGGLWLRISLAFSLVMVQPWLPNL